MKGTSPEQETEEIIKSYKKHGSLRQTVQDTGYSWNKIAKTLSTAGIIMSERHEKILKLQAEGKSAEEIAENLKLSKRTVESYIPRTRPIPGYGLSKNAKKIKRFRERKAKQEGAV